jgi:hypothetical protein
MYLPASYDFRTKMKMNVFWDVAPCSLVEIGRPIQRWLTASIILMTLMMETVNTSETLVSFYQTIKCNIPEDKSP